MAKRRKVEWKAQYIHEDILNRIRSGELVVGDAIESRAQLVQRYSASDATCRKAIRNLVQEGILEAYQGRGVFVRSTRGRNDIRQIALVAWSDQTLRQHPAFIAAINGFIRELAPAGYQLSFCFLDPEHLHRREMQEQLGQIHASGVIVTHSPHDVQEYLTPLADRRIPLVCIGRQMEKISPYWVGADTTNGVQRVLESLLEQNKKTTLVMARHVDILFEKRLRSIRAACGALGVAPQTVEIVRQAERGTDIQSLIKEIVQNDSIPDVIIADDDYTAYQVSDTLQELKLKIPQEIQLIGLGGFLQPPLVNKLDITTMNVPYANMAATAARMIVALVEDKTLHTEMEMLPCTVTYRSSCNLPIQLPATESPAPTAEPHMHPHAVVI